MLRIDAVISQRQPDGGVVKVEFGGWAKVEGAPVQIGKMLVAAEAAANSDGNVRIWLSMTNPDLPK